MQRRRLKIEVCLFSMPRITVIGVVFSKIIGLWVRAIVGSEVSTVLRVGARCIVGGGSAPVGGGGGTTIGGWRTTRSLYICVILFKTSLMLRWLICTLKERA
jgi:hypothetical protein